MHDSSVPDVQERTAAVTGFKYFVKVSFDILATTAIIEFISYLFSHKGQLQSE
jgi:hypothetical protein